MPIAKVNGIKIYYETHGKGEPLVIILGLSSNIYEYKTVIEEVAKQYKVLVFDNRGAGRSDKPKTPYSIKMMAKDTYELMQKTGFNKANIVGISLGGKIALEFAIKYPNSVKKLILISTGAKSVVKWWFYLFLLTQITPIFKGKYPQPFYAYNRQRFAAKYYNCTKELIKIKAPTLVLHGRKDSVAPYKLAKEMSDNIKNSKLEVFEGGHSFFVIKKRSETFAIIDKFLNDK